MNEKRIITWAEARNRADDIAKEIESRHDGSGEVLLYGVPRGGIHAATLVAGRLDRRGIPLGLTEEVVLANYIIDDLVDSGRTRDRLIDGTERVFLSLFEKGDDHRWYEFPWERMGNESGPEDAVTRLLQFVGEDAHREGLAETPSRYLKALKEWTSGYTQKPADVLKVFEDGAERYDEIVLLKRYPVYSLCEHHLAPFFGFAHVAYIPDKKIVGLSKLGRLVDIFARRLQVQERLTTQVAHALFDELSPQGVGVILDCRHFCMESRGVSRAGVSTITSAMLGVFRDNTAARVELFNLVNGGGLVV